MDWFCEWAKIGILGFFIVKRVSVLSIFIATAYDILRISTINEIKKKTHIKHTDLSATCLFKHAKCYTVTSQIDFLQYTDGEQADRFQGVIRNSIDTSL